MKVVILFLTCFYIVGCTNKSKQKEEKDSDTLELSFDNQREDTNASKEFDKKKQTKNPKDYKPIGSELPGFCLLYSKELPDSVCGGKKYRIGTEKACYTRDVKAIKLFVENRTKKYWTFGRSWGLEVWDGTKWCSPKQKMDLVWFDDAFAIAKAPLLYCFRFPIADYFHLPVGRYRIKKDFNFNDGKNLFVELYTEFKIK